MSLRAFHLFFIAASIAMCGVVAVWGFSGYRAERAAEELGLAVFCVLLGCALLFYGLRVFRKFQELGR